MSNVNDFLEHPPLPASIPEAFPEILRDLNRAILKAQPNDIISFCADYFTKKKAEESTGLVNLDNNQINPVEETPTEQAQDSGLKNESVPDEKEGNQEEAEILPSVDS